MAQQRFNLVVSYQAVGIDKAMIHESIPINSLCGYCSEGVTNCEELKRNIRSHHNAKLHDLVSTEIKVRRGLPPATKINISRVLLYFKKKRRIQNA